MSESCQIDSKIIEASLKAYKAKVFQEDKINKLNTSLPSKITGFEVVYGKNDINYVQNQNRNSCHIVFVLNYNAKNVPDFIKEDQLIFQAIVGNVTSYCLNFELSKNFLFIRCTIPNAELKTTPEAQIYLEYILDIHRTIHKVTYGKTNNLNTISYDEAPGSIDSITKDEETLLGYDLLNDSILSTVLGLHEILDKITDGDLRSCIVLSSHVFLHPMNWLLSPAALTLSFFHYQLLKKKSRRDENIYSKSNLPKVTYLSMTGIYSEIDIDTIHAYSENVQSIFIYDESTGGPPITRQGTYRPEEDMRENKIHFTNISDKILLLPLKTSSNQRKSYTQNDLLSIIEKFVIPSIANFKPSYIIINCSFIFDQDNGTPFYLDEYTLAYIVDQLKKIGNSQIIIYPFKLPNLENNETRRVLEMTKRYISEKSQVKRLDSILKSFAIPYNLLYLRNCFVNIFEVLSDLADENFFDRHLIRKIGGGNPHANEVIYEIARYYKKHTFYKYLYSKEFGILARLANDEFGVNPIEIRTKIVSRNKIPVYYNDTEVKMTSLSVDNSAKEIVLNESSQYLINYNEKNQPVVYILNAKLMEKNSLLKAYGPLSHFIVFLELEDTINQYFVSDYELLEIEENKEIEALKDSGMCICEDFVFQVYGTKTGKFEDTKRIFYYDLKNKTQYEVRLQEGIRELILPRHSVTACAFKKGEMYYLYVFGGQFQSDISHRGRLYSELQICDIVEIYQTKDLTKSEWEYSFAKKDSLTNIVSFVPFLNSFAHYDQTNGKIIIMGGKVFENSTYDWLFPVFKFDVEEHKFTSFDTYLNDAKNNPNRLNILNNKINKKSTPVAIADINRNAFFDPKENIFRFVIPSREEKYVCLYSYDPTKQASKFIEIQVDQDEINTQNINLESSKISYSPGGLKCVALDQRVSTYVKYMSTSKNTTEALLEIIDWRLNQQQDKLLKNLIEDEWTDILINWKKNLRGGLPLLPKELVEVLTKKDNRLHQIKEFLLNSNKLESTLWKAIDKLKTINAETKFNSSGPDIHFPQTLVSNLDYKLWSFVQASLEKIKSLRSFKICPSSHFSTFIKVGEELSKEMSTSSTQNISYNNKLIVETLMEINKSIISKLEENGRQKQKDKTLDFDSVMLDELLKELQITLSSTWMKSINEEYKISSDLAGKNMVQKGNPINMFDKDKIVEIEKRSNESHKPQRLKKLINQSVQTREETDIVRHFKECVSTINKYRMFLDARKRGVILYDEEKNIANQLRFKVMGIDEKSQREILYNISFDHSPSSVWIYGNAVICYIDRKFKVRYPDLYDKYKYWILYADLRSMEVEPNKGPRNLILKKLFEIGQDTHISQRCMVVSKESVFLLGGVSSKYKGRAKVQYHKEVLRYELNKYEDSKQSSTSFKDKDTEAMEENQGECIAISHQKLVYVCQKTNANKLEIFNEDGIIEGSVDFPLIEKCEFMRMNLIKYEGKEMILFTICSINEMMKFLLFDIPNRKFLKNEINFVSSKIEGAEEVKMYYTGFEEIEASCNSEISDRLFVQMLRGDEAQILTFQIKLES